MCDGYVEIKRPVKRTIEKVLSIIGILLLLLSIGGTLFLKFFGMDSPEVRSQIEDSLKKEIENDPTMQEITPDQVINLFERILDFGLWALIASLILSLLGFILMKSRVIAGLLFLLAAIVGFPSLLAALLFLIVAIMLFARKDRIEHVREDSISDYDRKESNRDYDRDDRFEDHRDRNVVDRHDDVDRERKDYDRTRPVTDDRHDSDYDTKLGGYDRDNDRNNAYDDNHTSATDERSRRVDDHNMNNRQDKDGFFDRKDDDRKYYEGDRDNSEVINRRRDDNDY
ncbi:DUF4064 domain-containing protein [Abyssicoccus albus]|uniref:Uncharacterized protein DUF4064 n=1 Tax=Abyssicoccus albus TaxID=1817405 RepID=A0A3N5CK83_9BACL|nr:DUF4064 domain-containing protein [Abyssicoccus albus]RPF58241.1 uncharacterized protein DUF4064 [Abyssicoccus albus]